MKSNAVLSKDRKYRYVLSRIWDETEPMVMFIGLNPSTADEAKDDPTLRRCINYAKMWGYGGIYMLNLFAFRATKPKDMLHTEEPIGDENDKYLLEYSSISDKIICAWGDNGSYKDRSSEIRMKFKNLDCLALNKSGEPSHPLYLKKDLTPKKLLKV